MEKPIEETTEDLPYNKIRVRDWPLVVAVYFVGIFYAPYGWLFSWLFLKEGQRGQSGFIGALIVGAVFYTIFLLSAIISLCVLIF